MKIKAGETWKVNHCRKGDLTIKFATGGDTSDAGSWLRGTIVEGRALFMSDENRLAQREEGRGTPGDEITMRASFITPIERISARRA